MCQARYHTERTRRRRVHVYGRSFRVSHVQAFAQGLHEIPVRKGDLEGRTFGNGRTDYERSYGEGIPRPRGVRRIGRHRMPSDMEHVFVRVPGDRTADLEAEAGGVDSRSPRR